MCGLSVTLFKGAQETEEDDFKVTLMTPEGREKGGVVGTRSVPVLDFQFTSLDILWRHLEQPHKFDGMILTSPRCVESLKKCLEESPDACLLWETGLKQSWLSKKIFCVGPSTATRFLVSFNLDENFREKIIVSEAGNSRSLAKSILQEEEKVHIQHPLLYPCGSLKMDTLGSCLTERSIPFEVVTVYQTIQNPDLEKLLNFNHTPASCTEEDVYVFFSPSGVGFVLPHLTDLSSKHMVAIGPTTADALRKSELTKGIMIHQCSFPSPQGLLEVLCKIKQK